VLLGVHHGIISSMTQRLVNDPRTLEITPVGSGKYGPDWFAELRREPGVAFVMPQTRSIAATMTLKNGERPDSPGVITPILAGGPGDPLLGHWDLPPVSWLSENREAGGDALEARPRAGVVLAESTARKLGATNGHTLEGRVERVYRGRRETAGLALRVLAVMPPEAMATDMAFVPFELLVATEEYRDGRAVPFLGWTGDAMFESGESEKSGASPLHEDLSAFSRRAALAREYASFRLYAAGLDDVTPLWRWFQKRRVEVYVRSAEIETVKSLDRAFTVVFGLITGAALFGFCASTAGSALAGVRRKSRSLGLMRLLGFPRPGILLFPVVQTVATGFFGFLLAFALYLGVAYAINRLFAASLPGGEAVCSLPPSYAAAVFGVVIALSALASLSAAWQADTIEPSEVIRDV
jgi:putative ABC transport system permease protein